MSRNFKNWVKEQDLWKISYEEYYSILNKYIGKKIDEDVFIEIADDISGIMMSEYGE